MQKVLKCKCGEFDYLNYPLVRFTAYSVQVGVDDVKEYIQILEEILITTKGEFIFIVDGTNLNWLGSGVRNEFVLCQKRIGETYMDRFRKIYLVVPNVLMHAVLRGKSVLSQSKVKQVICSTSLEAVIQAEQEIKLINCLEVAV